MTFRRAVMLVTRREFGERVRPRSFQIATVVTVLIVAAIAVAAGLLGGDGEKDYTVGAQGSEAVAIVESARAAAQAYDISVELKPFTDAAQARAAAKAEDVDAAIVGDELVTKGSRTVELEQLLQSATRDVRAAELLRREGVSHADARRALAPPPLRAARSPRATTRSARSWRSSPRCCSTCSSSSSVSPSPPGSSRRSPRA